MITPEAVAGDAAPVVVRTSVAVPAAVFTVPIMVLAGMPVPLTGMPGAGAVPV